MSETLININQNQLNTQNGSFTELIKSTQQGKEKLATALVDKGANVSSSSTLTDMANATANLTTLIGGNPIIGRTVQSYYNTNLSSYPTTYKCGIYVHNSYDNFRFKDTSTTNIIVYDLTPSSYSSQGSATVPTKNLTINATGYNSNYTNVPYFYITDDGSTLLYVNSDHTKVYKHTITYSSNVSDISLSSATEYSIPSGVITKTYNLIVNYNSETDDVIIKSTNSTPTQYQPTFYKFNLTSETLTAMSLSATLGSSDSVYCCSINANKLLVGITNTNKGIYIFDIDYTNNTVVQGQKIALDASNFGESSYSVDGFNKIQIGNKVYVAFIANNVSRTAINSYLFLIDTADGSYQSFSSNTFVQGENTNSSSTSTGGYYLYNATPFIKDSKMYLSGGMLGNLWEITVDSSNNFSVKSIPSLMLHNVSDYNTSNNISARSAICVMNDIGVVVFINSSAYVLTCKFNQLVAYKYNSIPFVPETKYYANISDDSLNIPSTDVLEEAE